MSFRIHPLDESARADFSETTQFSSHNQDFCIRIAFTARGLAGREHPDTRWRLIETVVEESAYCLESPRVLWAAALTLAAAVVAVLAVREIAVRVLHPDPAFSPLTLGPTIVGTIGCATTIYVFLGMVSYPDPVRTWRRVATVILIVSFVPNVLLAISHIMGAGWPEACALVAMHTVVWAICVTLTASGYTYTIHSYHDA
jgi:hypothetical protein